ncbi:MAG: hypothetical protein WD025_07385 [Bacteriovoracaceae bacterium]
MTKSLSICAFTFLIFLGATFEAHSQTRPQQRDRLRDDARARNGYNNRPATRPNRPVTRPADHSRRGHTRVDRNRPNRNGSYNRPGSNYRNHHPARTQVNRYSNYNHAPYRHNYNAQRRYLRSVNYARHLRQLNNNYFYRNWILHPSSRANGYYVYNNYPYFVFNGYQHRYSNQDYCDYQLVDSFNDIVVRDFSNNICSYAYDQCARERDMQNRYEYSNRYFCAENYQDNYYNY